MGSQTSSFLEERLKKACQTRHLSLSGLQLKDLNQLTLMCSVENKKKKVTSSIRPLVVDQTPIYVLDLSVNRLKSLPDLSFMYKNLRTCSLASNQFETLSKYFCLTAKFLKKLDISNNHLGNLPEEIVGLEVLCELNVSNNSLVKLPTNLGRLGRLESLNLEGNHLEQLEDSFGLGWTNLGELNLRRNLLKTLPQSVRGWTKMRYILLDINFIESLPPDLFQSSPHLIKLSLETNPIQLDTIQHLPDYENYVSRRKDQIDKRLRENLHNIKMIHSI